MANKGYLSKVAAHVGNMTTGSIVTVDEIRALIPDAHRSSGPQVLAELARGDNAMVERIRLGVYRVVKGRPGRGGRPKGAPTVFAGGAPEPAPPRRYDAPAPEPALDHAPDLLLTFLRGLSDGSGLYLDDTSSGIYKVVKIG